MESPEPGFSAYLEEHRIGDVLRALMVAISVDRPDDVPRYLLMQIDALAALENNEDIEWSVSHSRMCPRAPYP
jgi:hypothetical protein